MTKLEFIKRRKSSSFKLGDYVYFEHMSGQTEYKTVKTDISVGIVIDLPDDYTIKYGVCPLDTPEDTFSMIFCLPRDMRRLKKSEIKSL